MKNAIIYTRFSPRPNAKECDSCEKQQERCRAFCLRQEFNVINVFTDENVSGSVLSRPGITAAIGAIDRHEAEILVVDSVNRLARDMLVSLTIRHQIEQVGGIILYADKTPSDITPEGELFSRRLDKFKRRVR